MTLMSNVNLFEKTNKKLYTYMLVFSVLSIRLKNV